MQAREDKTGGRAQLNEEKRLLKDKRSPEDKQGRGTARQGDEVGSTARERLNIFFKGLARHRKHTI